MYLPSLVCGLYFLLADVIQRFHYLKAGLSVVLIFVGLKMLAADVYTISVVVSLAVILLILGVATLASWLWPRPHARDDADGRVIRL